MTLACLVEQDRRPSAKHFGEFSLPGTLPSLDLWGRSQKASEGLSPSEVYASCLRSIPAKTKRELAMNSRALGGVFFCPESFGVHREFRLDPA